MGKHQNLKANGRTGQGEKTWGQGNDCFSPSLSQSNMKPFEVPVLKSVLCGMHTGQSESAYTVTEFWWDNSPKWRAPMDRHRLLGNAGKKGEAAPYTKEDLELQSSLCCTTGYEIISSCRLESEVKVKGEVSIVNICYSN